MNRSIVMAMALGLALSVVPSVFSGGAQERRAPLISIDRDNIYISPNSSPGNKDALTIPLRIEADRANRMVVKEYRLTIRNERGEVVREWAQRDERQPGFFENIFIALGFMQKPAVEIPESVTWDGRDGAGAFVPDGAYSYVLEAVDDEGKKTTSEAVRITVDNSPPSARLSFEYRSFAPGIGGRRHLPVAIESSSEELWTAIVRNERGAEVARSDFSGRLPERFLWTGADQNNALLPDGAYTITVAAEDRAGNAFTHTSEAVRIDTRPRTLEITVADPHFSPNDNNVKDTLIAGLAASVRDGLEQAELSVLNAAGQRLRRIVFTGTLPDSITFDGRNDAGVVLADGDYTARLSVLYENGMTAEARSPVFTVKTTPPRASLSASSPAFSPDADGRRDTVTIRSSVSEALDWQVVIGDGLGNIFFETVYPGRPPEEIVWDGTDLQGRVVPEGTYSLQLRATDRAGNTGQSNLLLIDVDNTRYEIGLGLDYEQFSPDASGVRDVLIIRPLVNARRETEAYRVTVRDAAGRVVRLFEAEERVPEYLSWDGRDARGAVVIDGVYSAHIEALYVNGSVATAVSRPITVDTVAPKAVVRTDRTSLAIGESGPPGGIGFLHETSQEESWSGEIVSVASGLVVSRHDWKGRPENFTWRGTDGAGRPQEEGRYFYRLTGEDLAGNRTVVEVRDLLVYVLSPDLRVVAAEPGFSPNADGFMDLMTFELSVVDPALMVSWTLAFEHETRGVVETLAGRGAITEPMRLEWRGVNAPEGSYRAVFAVERRDGRTLRTVSADAFRLDVTPPAASLTVRPEFFAPGRENREQEVTLVLTVLDESPVSEWSVDIFDPARRPFMRWSGSGDPAAALTWDGYSRGGDFVRSAKDYPIDFRVSDQFGNSTVGRSRVSTDILVYREGGRYRIRIPNIQFAPFTAEYVRWNAPIGRENLASIDAVADMLKRFPAYRLRLDGHAVSLLWRDPAQSEREHREVLVPLSRERAQAIRQALIERGIAGARIDIEASGKNEPLVPFSDTEKRWINRRVEFILLP